MKRRGIFCQSWNCVLSLSHLLPAFMNTGWENIGFCSVLLALFCSWRITCIVFWWSSPPSFSVPLDPFLFPTHTTYVHFYSLLFSLKNSPSSIGAAHLLIDEELEAYRFSDVPRDVFLSHLRGDMYCIIGECFSVKVFNAKLSIKQVDTCSEWEFSVSELV